MLRSTSLALASCSLLLVSCGDTAHQSRPAQEAGLALPSLAQQPARHSSPAQVADAFMQAVDADDTQAWEALLTASAVSSMHADNGSTMDFNGDRIDSWTVGEEEVDGVEASVAVSVEHAGEEQALSLKLREEAGHWRVSGMGLPMEETEWLMSFEGGDDSVSELGEALGEALTEGLTEAFDGAMSEWEAGGSSEEIAAVHASYDELGSLDEDAHDATWSVNIVAGGRVAFEVLEELLAGTDFPIEPTDAFDHASSLELSGVSRLEALEALCVEADVVPVFPTAMAGWNDEPEGLSFRPGTRAWPVSFSGPFMTEVHSLEEHAPHTTGALTLTVRALGLHPAVHAANQSMRSYVVIEGLISAAGTNLHEDPSISWMGSPTLHHGLFEYSLTPDLVGLLSSVESFSVEGHVALSLPAEVHAGEFTAEHEDESVEAGPWSVEWTDRGTYNQIAFRHTDGETTSGGVRFAPGFSSGEPMGIQSESSYNAGSYLSANVSTPEAPATLGFKVFTPVELTYSFNVSDIPLEHFAEQPARLEPLAFSGSAPVAVEFVGFGDRSDPSFPKVLVTVSSQCNLEATDSTVTFEYIDASGTVLKDFPHNLTGEFTFEGTAPLALVDQTSQLEITAFFMPEETVSIRTRVEAVKFVNGTTWERE